jgi:hypothetical protein
MKKLSLLFFSLFICAMCNAQGQVIDRHPASQIFAIDYQSGQEIQVAGDQAILFKDAFIDLVAATPQSRQILRMTPGRKMAVIKQIDPQQKINGYQLTWQGVNLNRTWPLGTFYYNIDENALYYFDPGVNNWTPVDVEGPNQSNLDRCRTYASFNGNAQGNVPDLSVNGQQGTSDLSAGGQDQASADMQVGLDTLSDEDIRASVAPPELPQYEQPACPTEGYLWQPGYWGWNPVAVDYYWVAGVWVAPPHPGLLWTPGYWGFVDGVYLFHRGYWGATVGFYGGIHYGYGYFGVGFYGGGWRGGVYLYTTAVVRVNTTVIHNTYVDNTVIRNTTVVNRTSFNGRGGVVARPTAVEISASREQHFAPTNVQMAHQRASFNDRSQFAAANNGRPTVITMSHVTANPVMYNSRNNFNSRSNNVGQPKPNNGNSFNQPRPNNGNGFSQPRPNNGNSFNQPRPNGSNNAVQPRPNNGNGLSQPRSNGNFQNGTQRQAQPSRGNFNRQQRQPNEPWPNNGKRKNDR